MFVMSVSFANIPKTNTLKINEIKNIKYAYDYYEKEVHCVVTVVVDGQTYVGHGDGLNAREACDNAYASVQDFIE
jgi:hypothetical protein